MYKKLLISWAVRIGSIAAVTLIAGNLAAHGTSVAASDSSNTDNQQKTHSGQANNPFTNQTGDNSDDQVAQEGTDPSNTPVDPSGQDTNDDSGSNQWQAPQAGGFFHSGHHSTDTRSRAS